MESNPDVMQGTHGAQVSLNTREADAADGERPADGDTGVDVGRLADRDTEVDDGRLADRDTEVDDSRLADRDTGVDDGRLAARDTGVGDVSDEETRMAERSGCDDEEDLLPPGWREGLPPQDQQWVGRALFCRSTKGKLKLKNDLQNLWYYPPQPSFFRRDPPTDVHEYFRSRFFFWMPYRMTKSRIKCPDEDCPGQNLTSCGYFNTVRRVVDIDSMYYMGTENLGCRVCKKKITGWHINVLRDLPSALRDQFPALLLKNLSCDQRVYRLMRERGLGNSTTRLHNQLREQHTEDWLRRCKAYLYACLPFLEHDNTVSGISFAEPPAMLLVPTPRRLSHVYLYDVSLRLGGIKSKITDTFGKILKLDNNRKLVKKLGGAARGTAECCTNVGNEYNQVLVSVLTCCDGGGLINMAAGLVRRYADANKTPPQVLYVNRGCCGTRGRCPASVLFSEWPHLHVRLDITHFMRRIVSCVSYKSHALYGVFWKRLLACIVEYDAGDFGALARAKRAELLRDKGIKCQSDDAIVQHISKKEFDLHCRCRTLASESITQNIDELLDFFSSPQSVNMMGRPLLVKEKVLKLWPSFKQHVQCIQDPPLCELYRRIGSVVKGGVELPIFHCSRGTTSLWSFHVHQNNFIPDASAHDAAFQAYLLDGLARWNESRMQEMLAEESRSKLYCFDTELLRSSNDLWQAVHQRPLFPSFVPPRPYTGELLGVEYLYSQTGEVIPLLGDDPDDSESDDGADSGLDKYGVRGVRQLGGVRELGYALEDDFEDYVNECEGLAEVEESEESDGSDASDCSDWGEDEVGDVGESDWEDVVEVEGSDAGEEVGESDLEEDVGESDEEQVLEEVDADPLSLVMLEDILPEPVSSLVSVCSPSIIPVKPSLVSAQPLVLDRPLISAAELRQEPATEAEKSPGKFCGETSKRRKVDHPAVPSTATAANPTSFSVVIPTMAGQWLNLVLQQQKPQPASFVIATSTITAKSSATIATTATVTSSTTATTTSSFLTSSPVTVQSSGSVNYTYYLNFQLCPHPSTSPPVPQSVQPTQPQPLQPPLPRSTEYHERKRQELGQTRTNKRHKQFNICKQCQEPKTMTTGHSCFRGYTWCPKSGVDKEVWKDEVEQKRANKRKDKTD